MKATYGWLKELCPALGSAEEAAHLFGGVGLEVAAVEPLGANDAVIDLEVPSNRSDLLGVIGLAREIAAAKGENLVMPPVLPLETMSRLSTLTVRIEEPEGCPRYTALEAKIASGGRTPDWMRHRLEALGLRSIHPIVDLTNYVMLEVGQPMHAFDAPALKGLTIIIRRARAGETFMTLDERALNLTTDDLLIADAERGVALAGVTGGADSGIQPFTAAVVFESAWFHRAWIRATGKRHQVRTESSLRFEREVDPEGVVWAQRRIAYLLKSETLGEPGPAILDLYPQRDHEKRIRFAPERCANLIGLRIPAEDQDRILESLGFEGIASEDGDIVYRVPSHRRDVAEEEDLLEEIARHCGYDRIPESVSAMPSSTGDLDPGERLEDAVAGWLAGWGFLETITLPLRSAARQDTDPLSGERGPAVQNPLSEDLSVLRPSLVPALVDAVSLNVRRGVPIQPVFEIGAVFQAESDRIAEERRVGLLMPDATESPDWEQNAKVRSGSLFRLKGYVDVLAGRLNVRGKWIRKGLEGGLIRSDRALVLEDAGGTPTGWLAEIATACLQEQGVKGKVFAAEIRLRAVEPDRVPPAFSAWSPYPALTRDISLLVPPGLPYDEIEKAARQAGGNHLREIALFDRYPGAESRAGSSSLAFQMIFQRYDGTLTGKEVDEAIERVIGELERLGVKIRR
jgi:phenylalanyl-tRNA synthetase beta chain